MKPLAILSAFALLSLPLHAQLTPLTEAIRLEKFDEAKTHTSPELVNKMDQGKYHPLTYAAYTGNNELIEALLKAGANPNTVEHNGKTALYVVANLANPKGIKLLHQHGAKLPPKTALSPAVAAIYSSSLDTLKSLLEHYPNADLTRGWERARRVPYRYHQLGGPVSYACYYGYNDIALYLLKKHLPFNGTDYFGKGALHHAALNRTGSIELIKALLDAGYSPLKYAKSIRRHPNDQFTPHTPLALAVIAGNMDRQVRRGKIQLVETAVDEDPLGIETGTHGPVTHQHGLIKLVE